MLTTTRANNERGVFDARARVFASEEGSRASASDGERTTTARAIDDDDDDGVDDDDDGVDDDDDERTHKSWHPLRARGRGSTSSERREPSGWVWTLRNLVRARNPASRR